MLDATERKTLAWSAFIAGVLCLIPGEQLHHALKGPRPVDYVVQFLRDGLVRDRLLAHHATHIAWVICAALVAHHLWRTRKEEAAEAEREPGSAEPGSSGSAGG